MPVPRLISLWWQLFANLLPELMVNKVLLVSRSPGPFEVISQIGAAILSQLVHRVPLVGACVQRARAGHSCTRMGYTMQGMLNLEGSATAPCLPGSGSSSPAPAVSTAQACTSASMLSGSHPCLAEQLRGARCHCCLTACLPRYFQERCDSAQLRFKPCPADQRWTDDASFSLDLHATADHPDSRGPAFPQAALEGAP